MKSIKNLLFISLFFVIAFAKTTDFKVNKNAEIIVNQNRPVEIETSLYLVPQSREEIDLFVEDFENGTEGWIIGNGWELTTDDANSPTHSMLSPNNDNTLNGTYDMLSPTLSLPALGDGETMNFSFYLKGEMPDTDGDNDTSLDDYYSVSVMDVDALAWHASSYDSYDGNSYWCADESVGGTGGYLDSWIQFMDTPSFIVPNGASLTADLKWSIEDPAGAVVAGTCTDGWDAANVQISVDGGLTWVLLTGSDPYDFNCGYGWIWNSPDYDTGGPLNDVAAGWGGIQDWHNVSFGLSQYAGQEAMIRFAFGSDPAYSTLDDGGITGFHVDNILVTGALDCTPENDCDYSVTGAVWVDQFYDYTDADRPGYQEWVNYVAGLPFNGNVFLDISDFAEKDVTFRIQSRYDDNHDGGQGAGLFIDDFRIYKVSGGNTPPPTGLMGESQDMSVNLSWTDMNASGVDDFAFDNGQFDETNGITITGEGDAWAAEKFEFFGPSTINSIEVYSINTAAVDVTVGAFSQLGTLFDGSPSYSIAASLQPGWNTISIGAGWDMNNSFLIGYTFSDTVTAGLDSSGSSNNSMTLLNAGWDTWTDIATASDLPQGEWGVRANVSYQGAGVTYGVYVDGVLDQSGLTDNSATVSGLMNNTTYAFGVSATYASGDESVISDTVDVTPQAQTVHEESHDDGSAESFFNAGSAQWTAVKYTAQSSGEDVVRFKWLQDGDGGAFYLTLYADDNGVPGEETFSRIMAGGLVDGWNTYDLSSEGISVSGDFWAGTKEFSSTSPVGLDTDSDSGNSMATIGGAWGDIDGNLMIRVFLDCGANCSEEPACTAGDLNADGVINVLDIVSTVNFVLGSQTPSEDESCAADMNGDGIINVLDIVSIVNIVLGN
jgi:hypothetical protein